MFLKTMDNIQILMKNHAVILSQLVSDTQSLYEISCDAADTFRMAEQLSQELKIH
jgi:hypothetical protein